MKELVSKKIESVLIDKNGEHAIQFNTDSGPLIYEAEGDCCSESWFADLIGVAALIGHQVQTVEEVEMPETKDGRTRQEEDSLYGFKIATTGGNATIVFRNSSNGYYGGWLSLVDAPPKHVDMVPVTEDYSA